MGVPEEKTPEMEPVRPVDEPDGQRVKGVMDTKFGTSETTRVTGDEE